MNRARKRPLLPLVLSCTIFAACGGGGGGGGSSSLPPGGGNGGTSQPISLQFGAVLGQDGVFTPADGDSASGGQGAPVGPNAIPCDAGQINVSYHIHAYVGLYVQGVRMAIPDGIGMVQPQPEDAFGNTLSWTTCGYRIHTHDADGLIHIEDDAVVHRTLGDLFAVWGQPLSSSKAAGFSGTVQVYVASGISGGTMTNPYTLFNGDPQTIPLESHTAVVIEVGPPFVTPPPQVVFDPRS